MSESEIRDAIDAQEEHIKRTQSCSGQLGLRHIFQGFGRPANADRPQALWRECFRCGVTESENDRQARRGTS